MKNDIRSYAIIILLAGMFVTGCEKTPEQQMKAVDENVGKAKQELKDAQTDLQAEWQKFKSASEQQIDANEKKIDAFKDKMEASGPRVKAKYNKEVAKLEKKNHDLKQTLDDYKIEGKGKWEEFKTNFTRDMDDIGKTMKDLFKENG